MFGVRIIALIDTDKYYEFFQSVGSLSPEKPISFFNVNEDPKAVLTQMRFYPVIPPPSRRVEKNLSFYSCRQVILPLS